MNGGPNKWQYERMATFTPEFMTEPFFEAMKFFKRLYDEKLINQDFAVVDVTEIDKAYDTGPRRDPNLWRQCSDLAG